MASSDPPSDRPEPPPQHPFPLVPFEGASWYRVHELNPDTGQFEGDAFNDCGRGNARFSPLRQQGDGKVIPTLYLAEALQPALAEVVLHDVPTPSTGYLHDLERDLRGHLHVSMLDIPESLLVANLTSHGLRAAGLEPHHLFAGNKPDYPRTRRWAQWIWENQPDAQGLQWMSRRDNRYRVVMIFGDRVAPGAIQKKLGTVGTSGTASPLAGYEDLLVALLDQMGAGVMPRL